MDKSEIALSAGAIKTAAAHLRRMPNTRVKGIYTTVTGPGDGSDFMPVVTIWLKKGEQWVNQMSLPELVKLGWKDSTEARRFAENLLDACDRADKFGPDGL
jgi:hypothetical protein